MLRLLLTEARQREFDPFEDLVLADDRWPVLCDCWIQWVEAYVDEDGGGQLIADESGVRALDSGPSGIKRVADGTGSSRCGL